MRFRISRALAIALAASFCSCTPPTHPPFPKGRFIPIDPTTLTEITINQYENGKNWSATFKQIAPKTWGITSAPDSASLLDTLSNDSFLTHLVDTIPTLTNLGLAPKGTDEQLGLKPPAWYFIFGTPHNSRALELKTGRIDTQTGGTISSVSLESHSEHLIIKGAFFGLMSHVKNFQYLRRNVLITQSMDDIYKIEIGEGKHKKIAERQVNEWVSLEKKDITSKVSPWLERLTHLQIKQFFDELSAQTQIESLVKTANERWTVKLFNLEDSEEKWDFFRINKRVFARSNQRKKLFFELHSESWSTTKFTF